MLALATLVLALAPVGAGAAGSGPGDREISPPPNPHLPAPISDAWKSFDFYGHYDNKGVFVYSKVRVHQGPVKNFGVDLAGHSPSIVGEVRGTDGDLGRDLAETLVNSGAPCPGPGPCPRRPGPDPDPDPGPRPPIDPILPLNPAGGVAMLPLLLAGLLLSLAFLMVLFILLVVLVRRRP
jgi:hypothetical protein